MIISKQDTNNLKIIRESVRKHIELAAKRDSEKLLVLDVAPQIYEGAREFFKLAKVETLDIQPGATYNADICETNLDIIEDDRFDIIICTEVIEHVENPFNAVEEMRRILKKEGTIYLTTPFNFRIHGPMPDNWRFTEHGLRELFKNWEITYLKAVEDEDRPLMPIHYKLIAKKIW